MGPQETSIDDFDNNIVYEATTSVGPFVSGDYYTLSSIDYHFHTVTPAPETAVLSENEQYCVNRCVQHVCSVIHELPLHVHEH